nr:PREDICTED: uncharacterized protein LOC109036455 [Bemisia tabaci]
MSESSALTSLSFDYSPQDNVYSVSGSSLLNRLDSDDLLQLKLFFFPHERAGLNGEKKYRYSIMQQESSYCGIPLNKEEFASAINTIIGSCVYATAAANLFENLSKNNDESQSNLIWWVQILDAMIEDWDKSKAILKHIDEESVTILSAEHSKRETIIKIIPVETELSFCYIIICKYGRVGIYNKNLQLLDSYSVALAKEGNEEVQKISISCWVTDAIYLPDAVVLLIAGSNRSLHLFDISGLIHVPIVTISGMPNSPSCLHYSKGSPSMLFIGDDHGNITILSFLKPKHSLFSKNSVDESSNYFWTELQEQSEYVSISGKCGVHMDAVQQILYCRDNNTIASCSLHGETSLIIQHMNSLRTPYIYRLSKGIKCFYLNHKLRILITGSSDNLVRVWNPVVPRLPICSLSGHKAPIVDVTLLQQSKTVLSLSADGILKDWDIDNQSCIQTIDLTFPAFGIPGKLVEYGRKSIYPGAPDKDPPLLRQPKSGLMLITDISSLDIESCSLANADHKNEEAEVATINNDEIGIYSSILVACSNNIATVKLIESSLQTPHHGSLSEADPQPKTRQRTKKENVNDQQPELPSTQISEKDDIPPQSSKPETLLGKNALEVLPQIKMQRASNLGLNHSRVEQYSSEKQIQFLVEQCTPHLALKMSNLDQLQIQLQPPKNGSHRLQALFKTADMPGPERTKVKMKLDRQELTPSRVSSCSLTSHITAPSLKS